MINQQKKIQRESFGKQVKTKREALGLSKEEFLEKLNANPDEKRLRLETIDQIEKGVFTLPYVIQGRIREFFKKNELWEGEQ